MAQVVVPRRDGDVVQARLFWVKAAKLLDDESRILRVGFEHGPKGFDDIWVEYDPQNPVQDQFGDPLHIERFQCKWDATPGTFTYEDLTRPEFINASTTSFLERALAAYRADCSSKVRSRLALYTNHRIDQADPLHKLVRMKSSTVDLPKLFDGKVKSKAAAVRKLWREHLGLASYDELQGLVAALGFVQAGDSLDQLRERLDEACLTFGLVRPSSSSAATIYDTNVFEWVGQGRMQFDRRTFREKCEAEGLLAQRKPRPVSFGVKSFEHGFDRLEDRCAKVLNLVDAFEDRQIRDASAWRDLLLPKLRAFLTALPPVDGRLRIALDAHSTLAFAAGTVLNTKSGRLVEIEQRDPAATIWSPDDSAPQPDWSTFTFQEYGDAGGLEIYCGVSLSRQVEPQVEAFSQSHGLKPAFRLVAATTQGPSQKSVTNGAHAAALAEQLAMKIQALRISLRLGAARLHLFLAAPNAFTFEVGRHASVLGPLTLYEYDFEGNFGGGYAPSLSIP